MPVMVFNEIVIEASSKHPVLFAPEKTLTLRVSPSAIVAVVVNEELADGFVIAGIPLWKKR